MSHPADPRRRSFFGGLAGLAGLGAATTFSRSAVAMPDAGEPTMPPNPISLAQWSLHREIYGGKLDPLRFAEVTMK